MRRVKLYEYTPVRHFLLGLKENAGIKVAAVCERAHIRAKYCNLSKAEYNSVVNYMEDGDQFDFNHKNNCIINRERLYKLATVCYTENEGVKTIIDVHYHLNRSDNGYREIEQVKIDTWKILDELGYQKNLVIGGFERYKRKVKRHTPGVKHNIKTYKKVE